MENQEYYINAKEVKAIAEDGYYANRSINGFYQKTLSVLSAEHTFLLDYWFKSVINVGYKLKQGVRFQHCDGVINPFLMASFDKYSVTIDSKDVISFGDIEDEEICFFSIEDLTEAQVAGLIKTFKSQHR